VSTAELTQRACPNCGRSNADQPAVDYSRAPWRIKKCTGCAFVYLENPPPYSALSEDFAWEKTYESERERRAASEPFFYMLGRGVIHFKRRALKRNKLRRLLRTDFAPGNLLDVGCGGGGNLVGWEGRFVPFGVEISKALAAEANRIATERGGYAIHGSAMEGIAKFPEKFFQGAVLRSYLEHEVNPRGVLQALRRIMAPGGMILIKTPNFACVNRHIRGAKWCGFRLPDHVNYFTPQSLRRIVTESGFAVHRFGLLDHFPFSDNMWMVARAQ
jgi:SAM-dependent methyltransferase